MLYELHQCPLNESEYVINSQNASMLLSVQQIFGQLFAKSNLQAANK
jgi:hypothetical protein